MFLSPCAGSFGPQPLPQAADHIPDPALEQVPEPVLDELLGLVAALRVEAGKRKWKLYIPKFEYTMDNAAMIAWLGYEKYMAFPNLNYYDLYLNSYSRALFREKGRHR